MKYNTHKIYRSILKVGNCGHAVTLPIKWIRQHGIEKGDQVKVTEQGAGLLIEVSK